MMMTSRAQRRTARARKLAQDHSALAGEDRSSYADAVRWLRLLVGSVGLLPVLRAASGIDRPTVVLLLDHLALFLQDAGLLGGLRTATRTSLITAASAADTTWYIRMTRETVAALACLAEVVTAAAPAAMVPPPAEPAPEERLS